MCKYKWSVINNDWILFKVYMKRVLQNNFMSKDGEEIIPRYWAYFSHYGKYYSYNLNNLLKCLEN